MQESQRVLRQGAPAADKVKLAHMKAVGLQGHPTRRLHNPPCHRSLGDAYLKYAEFNGRPGRGRDSSAGRYFPPPYTPPYITSTPDVKHVPLAADCKVSCARRLLHKRENLKPSGHVAGRMSRGQFVIMASDGLWDIVTNEMAVEEVEKAIAENDLVHVSQR
jgi:serine/threonine protein phosphatase PrpC